MIRSVFAALVFLAPLLGPLDLRAQTAPSTHASAFLRPGHWASRAARRASSMGHGPRATGFTDGSLTRREAALILRAAAHSQAHASPEHARIASWHWKQFADEFPATVTLIEGDHDRQRLRGEGSIGTGFESRSAEFVPGFAEWIQHGGTGPIAVAARSYIAAGLTWASAPTSFLALEFSPRYSDADWRETEGYALFQFGEAGLWLGRRALRYGPGASGGLILDGRAAFDGGGLRVGGTRLPWLLRHFGIVRFEGFLSKIDSSFAVKDPWVMVNHASLSPHPRLLLGLTHGAIFGGSGRPPFTARNFIAMITLGRAVKGSADAEFENQLVAGEVRYRPPIGSVPLELHVVWGTEDNQGAWYQVPATQFGARIAAFPGLPSVSIGVERTEFEPPSPESGERGFHSNWYRHHIYEAGWTNDGMLLGHPLGGNGVEWLGWVHADLPDSRLRVDARAYMRERGPYNIYAPELKGYGHGAAVGAAWTFRSGMEATASLETERLGSGDIRAIGFAGLRVIF